MTLRPRLRRLAIAVTLLVAGCQVDVHRHSFELATSRDRLRLDVWLRPPPNARTLLLDTLLFPLDFVLCTWTCANAIDDERVAVTCGPFGWLATALPFCSANQYESEPSRRLAIDPARPEPQPLRVPVRPEDLAAIRGAADGAERLARFEAAVLASLPPGGAPAPGRLDRASWIEWIAPRLSEVQIVVPER